MKYLIEIPDGCKLLINEDDAPLVLDMLGATVVKERGYPSRIEKCDEGITVKSVPDDVLDPDSELAKANKKISDLLTAISDLKAKQSVETPL